MKKYLVLLFLACFVGSLQAQEPMPESAIIKKMNALDAAGKLPEALAITKMQFDKADNMATLDSVSADSLNRELAQYLYFWLQLSYADNAIAQSYTDSVIAILPPSKPFYKIVMYRQHKLPNSTIDKDRLSIAIAEKSMSDNMLDNMNVMLALANSCYYTQLYDSILPRYHRAEAFLAQAPASAEKEEMTGQLYSRLFYFYWGNLRNYEEAERCLEQLVIVKSKHIDIYWALLYEVKGDYDRALEYAENILTKYEKQELNNKQEYQQMLMVAANVYLKQNQVKKFRAVISKIGTSQLSLDRKIIMSLQFAIANDCPPPTDIDISQINASGYGSRSAPYILFYDIKQELKAGALSAEQKNKQLNEINQILVAANRGNVQQLPESADIFACVAEAYALLGEKGLAKNYYDTALAVLSSTPVGELNLESINDNYTLLRILKGQLESDITDEGKARFADASIQTLNKIRKGLTSRGAKEIALNEAPFFYEQALEYAYAKYEKNPSPELFEQALRISDQSKSILLLESLKENEALSFGGVPDSVRKKEKSLTNDISLYEAEAARAQLQRDTAKYNMYRGFLLQKRQQLSDLSKFLEKEYPKYYQIKHQNTELTLSSIQQNLPDGQTVLIDFFAGERHIYIFAISSENQFLIAKPIDKNYNTLLVKYYQLLTTPQLYNENAVENQKDIAQTGYQIYSLLLPELLSKMPEKTHRLVVIPDGLLNYIPLDALPTEKTGNENNFKQMPFLLRKYAISYHYSTALWLEARQSQKSAAAKQEILAFAPNYANAEMAKSRNIDIYNHRRFLKDLTGTKAEVTFLEKMMPKGLYFYDANAVEAQFKANASQYAILHLAMHGVVDKTNPMYSAMVFSENGDSTEDNFLHAYELQSINLNADLVVLSACETGYGKYQHGEGVVSIGRGFMYAGVPNLVMTLWSVNDQSTANIMQLFYQHLAKGLPTDQAMQQAKINYLDSQQGLALHPNFWSAFTVVGKAQPVSLSSNSFWFWAIVAGASVVLIYTLVMLYNRTKEERA
jgi:CHAT domain-containing protein